MVPAAACAVGRRGLEWDKPSETTALGVLRAIHITDVDWSEAPLLLLLPSAAPRLDFLWVESIHVREPSGRVSHGVSLAGPIAEAWWRRNPSQRTVLCWEQHGSPRFV